MDTIVITIISITLLATLGSIYVEIRRQIKPRIKVYFPDGLTRASYKVKEEANVSIHIRNIGRRGFPKPAATHISVFVYVPTSFLLKTLQTLDATETTVRKAPLGGIFGSMQYLATPADLALSLFHKEEDSIKVLMQMPEETGKQPIRVAVLSEEGDLGIHELEIIIS